MNRRKKRHIEDAARKLRIAPCRYRDRFQRHSRPQDRLTRCARCLLSAEREIELPCAIPKRDPEKGQVLTNLSEGWAISYSVSCRMPRSDEPLPGFPCASLSRLAGGSDNRLRVPPDRCIVR